jgi:protein-tyrosine-phosphatase
MSGVSSILFICTGNSCRSIMAEGLMRKSLYELGKERIEVASAGTMATNGMPPTDETVKVMKEAGVDVSDFKAKSVTPEMVRKADLILVMEPMHKDSVLRKAPQASSKTFLLKEYGSDSKLLPKGYSVHDPIGKPVEDYRITRDEISAEIERIAGLL